MYKGKPFKVKIIMKMSVITIRIPGINLLGGSPSAIKKLIWAGAQACQDCLCCFRDGRWGELIFSVHMEIFRFSRWRLRVYTV